MELPNLDDIPTLVEGYSLSTEQRASLARGHIIVIEIDGNSSLEVTWNGTAFVTVTKNEKAAYLQEVVEDLNELNDIADEFENMNVTNDAAKGVKNMNVPNDAAEGVENMNVANDAADGIDNPSHHRTPKNK